MKTFLFRKYDFLMDSLTKVVSALKQMKKGGYSDVQIVNNSIFLQGGKIKKIDTYTKEHNMIYAYFLLTHWELVSKLTSILRKSFNYITPVYQKGKKVEIDNLENILYGGYETYISGNTTVLKEIINKFLAIFEKYDVICKYELVDENGKRILDKNGKKIVESISKENPKYFDIMREQIQRFVEDLYTLNMEEEKFYEEVLVKFKEEKYCDFSFKMDFSDTPLTFRGVMDLIEKGISLTIRKISEPLDVDELLGYCDEELKTVLKNMFLEREGMLLISGPTGSGKTTFLISMIEMLNQKDNWNKIVFTVENPIEYFFQNNNYTFFQKNVGQDINSFKDGIKVALRKHPDIIMVGETRDTETVDGILSASETGHLAITTLHLSHPRDVITRISSLAEKDKLVLDQLSKSLVGIINIGLAHVEKEVKEEIVNEKGEKEIITKKQKFIIPYYEVLRVDPVMASFIKRGDVDSIKEQFKNVEMIKSYTCYPRELYLLRLNQKMPEIFTEEHLLRLSDKDFLEDMEAKYNTIYPEG